MNDDPKILGGRYEVGDLIGRGGMAEVHIGYDTRLGRTVAIKILRADLARDPSFQTRFRREAQAAAGLNHPAIVAVYDTGEESLTTETGQIQTVPYIVMEYVEGHTVRDILKGDVAAPIDEAVEITSGVLTALDYAHHAGLVHRDIKPANVMLTPTGAVKVMDFGIARALADAGQTMTQTQAVVGTAQYLSPEQARGENVDARSDLYSAGCLLFELLTGRPPFVGDSPVSVAYQHVREEAPIASSFASDVPPALDAVVAKALRKNKDERYSSAQEFLADLRRAMGQGSAAPGAGYNGFGASGVVGAAGAGAAGAAAGVGAGALSPQTAATTQLPPAFPATAPDTTGATAVMPQTVSPAGQPGWASVVGSPDAGAGQGAVATVPATSTDLVYDDPNKRKWKQIGILIGAVLAAGLLIWALFAMTNKPPADETPTLVTIPNLENQTVENAKDVLAELNLVPVVEEEPSQDVEAGRVIRTDPETGTEVEPGSEVTIYASLGPSEITIPTVRGMTESDAKRELEDAGLIIELVESTQDPIIERGRVTATFPAEGEIVGPGSKITLYVSDGQVELPELRKKQEAEARTILTDLSLIPNVIYVETTDFPAGEVIKTNPAPGLVPQRSAVTLEIAKAPSTVPVPNVVGQTETNARSILSAAGFNVSTTTQQHASVAAGLVISQNPSQGIPVAPGATVSLVISSGPPPTETTTPPAPEE